MKIKEVQVSVPGQSVAVGSVGSTLPADAPNPIVPVAAADRISTSDSDRLRSSIASGVTLAMSERTLRLDSLAQAVRSGNYRPSSGQLAEQILASAELDARLASLFS